MNIEYIKSGEKRSILKSLNLQFGIEELPYLLLQVGREKIRGFSGHLSKEEIAEIAQTVHVELIGLYLIKKEDDYRLSIDATSLFKNQIKKNIIELSENEFQSWIRGKDLEKEHDKGTFIIKHKGDFIGCTKSNGKILFNYVPKDRRLRKN